MQFESVRELVTPWEAHADIPLPINRDSSFQLFNESVDENVLFTIWDVSLRERSSTDDEVASLALITACRSEMESADKQFNQIVSTLQNSTEHQQHHPFLRRSIIRAHAMRTVIGAIFNAVSDNVSLVGQELFRSIMGKVVSTWGGKERDYLLLFSIPNALQEELLKNDACKTEKKGTQQRAGVVGDGIGICAWLGALLKSLDVLVDVLTQPEQPNDQDSPSNVGKTLLRIRKATALIPESGRSLHKLRVQRRSLFPSVKTSSQEIPTSCAHSFAPLVLDSLWGSNGLGMQPNMDENRPPTITTSINTDIVACITLQHSATGDFAVFPLLSQWDSECTTVSWGQLVVQSSHLWGVKRPYFKVDGETCITSPTDFFLWKKSPQGRFNLVVFEHYNSSGLIDGNDANIKASLTSSLLADAALYGPYISSSVDGDDGFDVCSPTTTREVGLTQKSRETDIFISTKLNYPNGTKGFAQRQLDVGESSSDLASRHRAKLLALIAEEESEQRLQKNDDPQHESSPSLNNEASPARSQTIPVNGINQDDHLSKIYARVAPEAQKAGVSLLQCPFRGRHSQAPGNSSSPTTATEGEEDIAQECEKILKDLYSRSSKRRELANSSSERNTSPPRNKSEGLLASEAQQHLRRLVRLS